MFFYTCGSGLKAVNDFNKIYARFMLKKVKYNQFYSMKTIKIVWMKFLGWSKQLCENYNFGWCIYLIKYHFVHCVLVSNVNVIL